jgi:hypothetical protein
MMQKIPPMVQIILNVTFFSFKFNVQTSLKTPLKMLPKKERCVHDRWIQQVLDVDFEHQRRDWLLEVLFCGSTDAKIGYLVGNRFPRSWLEQTSKHPEACPWRNARIDHSRWNRRLRVQIERRRARWSQGEMVGARILAQRLGAKSIPTFLLVGHHWCRTKSI